MQEYFYQLADYLSSLLQGGEIYTCTFDAEDSDFVRFNRSTVRQAGTVTQRSLAVNLIHGQRHTHGGSTLSGDWEEDAARVAALIANLRAQLPYLPEDPHLLYATEVRSSERHGQNRLPEDTNAVVAAILAAGRGKDLVGIYAAGGIYAGFANSFGQRNWFSSYSYNFDWSFYHQGDKAVKCSYAGFLWDPSAFAHKVAAAGEQLSIVKQPPRTIAPGRYRVYLAPGALADIVGLLGWGGFGLKDHRTKQTVLLKMVEEGARLHPMVTLEENTAEGVGPNFQEAGFMKPDRVTLIDAGAFRECLVSPRSAKEYGAPTNGASSGEMPESLVMAAGTLPDSEILPCLDTGVYINNVWYLNYSDRVACRITGMTRFATFWVENGAIQAPLNVMRFDETLYRMLGENLVALTAERELLLDSSTYGARSTASSRMPGAVVKDFTFTL
ncbi:MAG TPA: metallopeptidase TldD-related protein [Methylomirabilota bacterium]|jgi:predicted Zn-dependent protease|nr:metallopeptidase TldD-related protein [Methylomirabilota bacterium]